jgi:DNA-binding transcriptional MerR regulator
MDGRLTISALARATGVRSKTLRYWESLGLLPRAERSHAAYRLFEPGAVRYVEFVRKCKRLGLTLREMREVLTLARAGQSPCPAVENRARERLAAVEREIRELEALRSRLARVVRARPPQGDRSREYCCLLAGLPEAKAFPGKVCHARARRRTRHVRSRARG